MSTTTKSIAAIAAIGACLAITATGAFATAGEKVDAAGRTASSALNKTDHAIRHGASAAATGVEKGAKATERVIEKGATKIGLPAASSPTK